MILGPRFLTTCIPIVNSILSIVFNVRVSSVFVARVSFSWCKIRFVGNLVLIEQTNNRSDPNSFTMCSFYKIKTLYDNKTNEFQPYNIE